MDMLNLFGFFLLLDQDSLKEFSVTRVNIRMAAKYLHSK